MTSSELQCVHRILQQFDQDGHFETEEPEKIRYIGYLQDAGYVVAIFTPQDGAPFTKAAIQRLTYQGSEKIKLLAPEDAPVVELDYAQILKDAEEIRRQSSKSYDTMIKTISTGGLGLIATILMFLYSKDIEHPSIGSRMMWFCYIAGLIWIINLVALLVLDRVSQTQQWDLTVAAHRRQVDIEKVNNQSRNIDLLNFLNGILVLIGLGFFLVFVVMFVLSRG